MRLQIDKKIKFYFYLIFFLLFSTFYNSNLELYFNKKFKIDNIENKNENMEIYELNYLLNRNIFYIDKKLLSHKLKNNPIFRSYEIKKIYPNTLRIQLVKSNVIAKIVQNGSSIYLGDNGKIFYSSEVNNQIPEIQGTINLRNINKVIKILNYSSFNLDKIKMIKFYPSNRFDLIFSNKNIIKFPKDIDQKFIENAFIFHKNNIYNKIIDLRLKNKIITTNE